MEAHAGDEVEDRYHGRFSEYQAFCYLVEALVLVSFIQDKAFQPWQCNGRIRHRCHRGAIQFEEDHREVGC
jgi:hypothetical protein